ncbi:MAG TPA: hypothetical protein VEY30_05210, partial [Myxococcaceae bacterium]|nr:hypothetical protein [Myxococcaceae bacterium]
MDGIAQVMPSIRQRCAAWRALRDGALETMGASHEDVLSRVRRALEAFDGEDSTVSGAEEMRIFLEGFFGEDPLRFSVEVGERMAGLIERRISRRSGSNDIELLTQIAGLLRVRVALYLDVRVLLDAGCECSPPNHPLLGPEAERVYRELRHPGQATPSADTSIPPALLEVAAAETVNVNTWTGPLPRDETLALEVMVQPLSNRDMIQALRDRGLDKFEARLSM